jgi:hypothetical protein
MALEERDAERIAGALRVLADRGPSLGRPVADTIKGSQHHNMKELRSFGGHIRMLFAFDRNQTAVMLVGGDKSGNWKGWYRENIPKADRLFSEHQRREGGWGGPGRKSSGRER